MGNMHRMVSTDTIFYHEKEFGNKIKRTKHRNAHHSAIPPNVVSSGHTDLRHQVSCITLCPENPLWGETILYQNFMTISCKDCTWRGSGHVPTLYCKILFSGGSRIFPGGANSQNCYYFSHFCRKLHENERIWTPGGARVPGAPLGSANAIWYFKMWHL